jgi:hypothetical protein
MTDIQKPKGSNGTVTAASVEKGSHGATETGMSGSNDRHNGTTKPTTPQRTNTTGSDGNSHGNGEGNSKDAASAKSGKKRRKVNHGSWAYPVPSQ